jgi:bile acid:Na+ symporter, BASS family
MNVDKIINILVTITLIEMMISIGLGVTFQEILAVAKNWRVLILAGLANYICVPLAAVALLVALHAHPMVIVGFLIVAVCPGAPYGPPFTGLAKGNVPLSTGLMVILAGSSAVLAPLLLGILIPLLAKDEPLKVDAAKMVTTLLVSQLLPLLAGLLIQHWRPALAAKLLKPATKLSAVLNLVVFAFILAVDFKTLTAIRAGGFLGMTLLLLASIAAGWLSSERGGENRRAMALTTSVRNVGVSLVIATGSFAGTAAPTAALAYALFQTILMALVAVGWGRMIPAQPPATGKIMS